MELVVDTADHSYADKKKQADARRLRFPHDADDLDMKAPTEINRQPPAKKAKTNEDQPVLVFPKDFRDAHLSTMRSDWRASKAKVKDLAVTASKRMVPSHVSASLKSPFTVAMKSDDWIKLMSPAGVYYIDMLLPDTVEAGASDRTQELALATKTVLMDVVDWLWRARQQSISTDQFRTLKEEIPQIVATFEALMPTCAMSINVHMLLHICSIIEQFGPLNGVWMMGFERFGGKIIRQVKGSKRLAQDQVINRYKEFSLCNIATVTGDDIRYDASANSRRSFYVNTPPPELSGKRTMIQLNTAEVLEVWRLAASTDVAMMAVNAAYCKYCETAPDPVLTIQQWSSEVVVPIQVDTREIKPDEIMAIADVDVSA